MDMLDEVSFLVRGEDLITEYALYEYYVEKFGFPKVVHWYLPRLMILDGENVVEMSKTKENGDVARYLAFCEGSYEDLVKLLKRSYLKNPAGTWEIQNVKENPVLSKVKIK
jgi:glutamyl/glutaminyl-tRNA synthetase